MNDALAKSTTPVEAIVTFRGDDAPSSPQVGLLKQVGITSGIAAEIPAELRGYVQVALDMNILNAYFNVTQGPYDLYPTVHATFNPKQKVTRGDYAVAATRFYSSFLMA